MIAYQTRNYRRAVFHDSIEVVALQISIRQVIPANVRIERFTTAAGAIRLIVGQSRIRLVQPEKALESTQYHFDPVCDSERRSRTRASAAPTETTFI